MRINEIEEAKLRLLYEVANEKDTPEAWQDVRNYYSELGRKYGFNPRQVMINTKGEVTRRSYQTIYVVVNRNTADAVNAYHDKETAMEHAMESDDLQWSEVGLL